MTEEREMRVEASAQQKHDTTLRPSPYDRLHLKMISLVHDTLYGLFIDPNVWLRSSGLKPGQTVLEVGCGPGFFTIPAAEILGRSGRLYTLDINPAAVMRVKRKVKADGVANVEVFQADAARTGLPDESVDVAFLFGILRSLKDLDSVLKEMNRVLRKNGVLAAQKSRMTETALLDGFTKDGLFHFVGKGSRIYRFEKGEVRMRP